MDSKKTKAKLNNNKKKYSQNVKDVNTEISNDNLIEQRQNIRFLSVILGIVIFFVILFFMRDGFPQFVKWTCYLSFSILFIFAIISNVPFLYSFTLHFIYLITYFYIRPDYLMHRYYIDLDNNISGYMFCFDEFFIKYMVWIIIYYVCVLILNKFLFSNREERDGSSTVYTGNLLIKNNIISRETRESPEYSNPSVNIAGKFDGIIWVLLFILAIIFKQHS